MDRLHLQFLCPAQPELPHRIRQERLCREHNDPKPITDIQHFKVDSFQLIVVDPATGGHAAVVPVAPPGSGNAQVEVIHTSADHPLQADRLASHAAGQRLILSADNPIAKQAFAKQT